MNFFTFIMVCFLMSTSLLDVRAIINGYNAAEGEFPHAVLLQMKDEIRCSRCGGGLITMKHVLTAAHCVARFKPRHIEIVAAGFVDFHNHPSMQQRGVEHFEFQEKYMGEQRGSFRKWIRSLFACFTSPPNGDLVADIAMLTLKSEFAPSDVVKTIDLPPEGYQIPFDQIATFSGWGQMKIDGEIKVATHLQGLNLLIVKAKHDSYFRGMIVFDDGTFGEAGQGDSGSSLFKDGKVIGLAQSVDNKTHVSYFTSVPYYLGWIKDYLRRHP